MRPRTLSCLALIALAACGAPQSVASPSAGPVQPSAAATPIPIAIPQLATPWPATASAPCAPALPAGSPPLMVVLESRGPNASGGIDRTKGGHDYVVIADLNANGRARAAFQSRIGPYIGGARLSPNEAYAVRGSVYFIDGYGTVFRLGLDGKQAVVTKFPISITTQPGSASTSNQEVSFAVSPDGCQLAATVITSGTPWKLETMRASAGGSAEVLHTWTGGYPNSQGGFANLVLLGWDSIGPIVVVGSNLGLDGRARSEFIANPDFVEGTVAHLAGDGTYGGAFGSADCKAVQVSLRGDVACYTRGIGLSVERSTGGTEFGPVNVDVPGEGLGGDGIAYLAVGPNGMVALAGNGIGVASGMLGQWHGPNGASGTLPTAFYPEGWVDSRTIFGRVGSSMNPQGAALVRIGAAQPTALDLGFVGDFVGMLGG